MRNAGPTSQLIRECMNHLKVQLFFPKQVQHANWRDSLGHPLAGWLPLLVLGPRKNFDLDMEEILKLKLQ